MNVRASLKSLFKEEAKARESGSKLQGGNAPKSSNSNSSSSSNSDVRVFEHRVGIEWTRIHAQESYRDSSRSTTDYARDNHAGEDV